MRVVQNPQMQVGEVDVPEIRFDPKSRDDIPKVLKGLQYLYCDLSLRSQVFELLEKEISPKVSKDNGRPGMALWKILVCGVLRLDLNIDYDRLHEMVNQHGTIRQMLGHGAFDLEPYQFQTLKDNVALLTPELLDKINQVVVSAGHDLVKKRKAKRCMGGAIPLWLRRTCIIRPISTCCLTRCARSWN
jgi:transposase, IS5 family